MSTSFGTLTIWPALQIMLLLAESLDGLLGNSGKPR